MVKKCIECDMESCPKHEKILQCKKCDTIIGCYEEKTGAFGVLYYTKPKSFFKDYTEFNVQDADKAFELCTKCLAIFRKKIELRLPIDYGEVSENLHPID